MDIYKEAEDRTRMLDPKYLEIRAEISIRWIIRLMKVMICGMIIKILFNTKYLLTFSGVIVLFTLNTEKIIHKTSDKYLSVALDTSLIQERWAHLNISSKKFLRMVQHLSPAYLRVGGTTADRLMFNDLPVDQLQPIVDGSLTDTQMDAAYKSQDDALYRAYPGAEDEDSWAYEDNEYKKDIANFTMTGDDWIMINNFAKDAGLRLLFDLNVLLRDGDMWNSENAQELIQFSDKHGFNLDWQLGNEPNSFPHVFNVSVSGYQLGKDFVTLKYILGTYRRYSSSLLVGPDVTRPKFLNGDSIRFLKEFLTTANNAVDAVTWHQYYLDGHVAEVSDFLNPATLNVLYKQIRVIKEAVRKARNRQRFNHRIWLSETGSAYGGGAAQLSDRFIAGFLWLDKLGVAARSGVDVVVRQSLYRGFYSLFDEKTLDPLPDWWLSVLFKTLVGPGVIKATALLGATRLYAHCTPRSVAHYSHGTITIFGLNMLNVDAHLSIYGLPERLPDTHVAAYILTGETGLQSKYVQLNGKRLTLRKDGSLPSFIPDFHNKFLVLPPYSIGFFVMHGIPVPACKD